VRFADIGLTADFRYREVGERLERIFVRSNDEEALLRLVPGETAQLEVIGRTEAGSIADLSAAKVRFESRESATARVDGRGRVKAASIGLTAVSVEVEQGEQTLRTLLYVQVGS